MYVFYPFRSSPTHTYVNSIVSLWHSYLAHASCPSVQVLKQNNIHVGKTDTAISNVFCDTCVQEKMHQLPFSKSDTSYNTPLDLVTLTFGLLLLCLVLVVQNIT